jgi:hypothetical protein
MYFEGRELNSLPRPVSKEELKINEVYFRLRYLDNGMLIPNFDAVVFIGTNLDPEHEGEAYFQDYESHQKGISFSSHTPDDGSEFFIVRESRIGFIFDYDHALEELIKCSMRRRKPLGSRG